MKYAEMKNRKVLITGGTQGIGEAMAETFTADGADVVINGRVLNEKVQKVLDRTGARASMGSIIDPATAEGVVKNAAEIMGGLDVLICNAAGMSMAPYLESVPEEWWSQIKINLSGHMACIRTALPIMKANGGGTIILTSSFFGTIGWNNATGYGSSKSGLLALGQYLARAYKDDNIKVCTIIPGVIDTPQLNVDANDLGISLDEVREMYANDIAMGRLSRPSEIAETALYMASDAGRKALNGRHIIVSGGEYRSTPYYI